MPHVLAQSVEILTTVMAVAGMGYFLTAMVAARVFLAARRAPLPSFAPGVSILKSLKGLDPGMIEAFRSHCAQSYAGEFELLFGVSTLSDPAASAVEQLKREFPSHSIQLILCPERLGTNGKVSTLAQLVPHARHNFLLINDSDITVSSRYLERVMAHFATCQGTTSVVPKMRGHEMGALASTGISSATAELANLQPVGLVTALYRGRAHRTFPSRLEALGIATDFQAGVLLSKMIEGGLHYGLGSTLAVSREALDKMNRALSEYMITGIKTTIAFEQAILQDPNFRRGVYSTNFLEQLLGGARGGLIGPGEA